MIGPGKYDDLTTYVREQAAALGVLVLVFEGRHGNGFSAQLPAHILSTIPGILREVALQIEADARRAAH